MTRAEVILIIKYISRAYRNFNIDPSDLNDTVTVWHDILQDISGETAQRVTRQLCRINTQFPPTPAEIYQTTLDEVTRTVYEVERLETEQALLELKEYHETENVVPMPERVRKRLEAIQQRVQVTSDES